MSIISNYLRNYAVQELAQQSGLGAYADPVIGLLSRVQSVRSPRQGGSPPPSGDIQSYAKRQARQMFGKGHWDDLDALVTQESGWNPKADNPTSSAYGLFQFLDSTAQNYAGKNIIKNPYKQIDLGLKYIADRYGNPTKAWDFHQANNYY